MKKRFVQFLITLFLIAYFIMYYMVPLNTGPIYFYEVGKFHVVSLILMVFGILFFKFMKNPKTY